MNKQKGFTIIELIVVIAIIAVLAGIVLVNVTQYINKGKDAAIEGNLSSAMTDAAIYFDSSISNSSSLCANTTSGFATAYNAATALNVLPASGTHNCTGDSSSTVWMAYSQLNNKGSCTTTAWFCVDSRGVKKVLCADPGAVTACP